MSNEIECDLDSHLDYPFISVPRKQIHELILVKN